MYGSLFLCFKQNPETVEEGIPDFFEVLSAFRDRGSLSRRVNVAACPSLDGSSA
jgi:hypothetical protein